MKSDTPKFDKEAARQRVRQHYRFHPQIALTAVLVTVTFVLLPKELRSNIPLGIIIIFGYYFLIEIALKFWQLNRGKNR